jgi:hypothetical protein
LSLNLFYQKGRFLSIGFKKSLKNKYPRQIRSDEKSRFLGMKYQNTAIVKAREAWI